jgi:cellulose synthase/poly-beta-1,6-N-acetylglucosamine synthase-like glycosyltransferase
MHYLLLVPVATVASLVGLQLMLLAVQFVGSTLIGREVDDSEVSHHIAKCAVVVPAHDEEGSIVATVRAIQAQLHPGDRLIVVADNCTDETANLALEAGAETIERRDTVQRGKGFALDRGIRYIEAGTTPQVVVIIDADCVVEPGCISRLVNTVESTGRPAQGRYLMYANLQNSAMRIAEFAFKIKNYVRPGGGARFGLPCLLYGTGMAFPWSLVQGSLLANGHLTEDLKLAIDASLLGLPPVYCSKARCNSTFPETKDAMSSQRKRWEHGYFSSVIEYMPKLLTKALSSGDWRLLSIALDLSIPPLGLMLLITFLISCLGLVSIIVGANTSIGLALVLYFPSFATLIILAWYFHGRQIISGTEFFAILKHAFQRVSILLSFVTRPQREWIRTERKNRE